jgi:hypothetical protein
MMDDKYPFAPTPATPERETSAAPETPEVPAGATAPPTAASAAVLKFKSCRWRCDPEAGEFCTHRDVLPFAGKEGFSAESWCPECEYYKLRRTPRKRERVDYSY